MNLTKQACELESETQRLTISQLCEELKKCAEEFATNSLCASEVSFAELDGRVLDNCIGTSIQLVGEEVSFDICVEASDENAKSLVAKFLMMTVEELEEEDFKDAFGEVTNILGGQIRPLITEHHPGVTLGFPAVYQGVRFFSSQQEVAAMNATFDGVELVIRLVKSNKSQS